MVLLIPANQSHEFIHGALSDLIRQKNFRLGQIIQPDKTEPLSALLDTWKISPVPTSLNELICHTDCPEITLLDGRQLATEPIQSWLRFVERWSDQVRQLDGIERSLCLCVNAEMIPKPPTSDVKLSVRWWWRTSSALETQLYCRGRNMNHTPLAIWREYLLPSIVAGDLSLIDPLWDIIVQPIDATTHQLRHIGQSRGWTIHCPTWKHILSKASPQKLAFFTENSPPPRWRPLWDNGALCFTPEYGLEIHPAAIALLDRHPDLEQRIWRGQAALLLPFLDSIRLDLCRRLTQRFSPTWALSWAQPADYQELERVKKSVFAVQWGHMVKALYNASHNYQLRQEKQLATVAQKIRNELAHYRPICFADFTTLWEMRAAFEQKGTTV
ncbi:MAG: hypothetical protein FOGNACKC_03449 [Anaerolineae bacterium]|nr:hypothetical protein [Anaerolineae bacterium]